MLKQQIIGVINLSIPLIILCLVYPTIFFVWYGKIACSLAIGIHIWILNKQSLIAMTAQLTFRPTDQSKEMLEQQIHACNLQPQNITLFYAYTDEALAIAASNNIIIDPMIWSTISDDPESLKVQTIITPTLSDVKKLKIQKTLEIFSHDAQSFIFKHELGHVARQYSLKKLFIVFLIGTLSTYIGIESALSTLSINSVLAVLAGMFAGGLSDLVLSYLSNGTFKAHEEKQADIFAIRFSSAKEIEAAAIFFEQYQNIIDEYGDKSFLRNILPSTVFSGHLDGKSRAALLRSQI